MESINNQECCPKFNPSPWENKEFFWDNKKFVKDKVFTLFSIPFNFGSVISRMARKIEASGTKWTDYMCLSDCSSSWNMNLYLAVDKEIPDMKNISLSGKFFSRVYEGNFRDMGRWFKDFKSCVEKDGKFIENMYVWYTTCPKCAEKYGKNYVVIIGKIKTSN